MNVLLSAGQLKIPLARTSLAMCLIVTTSWITLQLVLQILHNQLLLQILHSQLQMEIFAFSFVFGKHKTSSSTPRDTQQIKSSKFDRYGWFGWRTDRYSLITLKLAMDPNHMGFFFCQGCELIAIIGGPNLEKFCGKCIIDVWHGKKNLNFLTQNFPFSVEVKMCFFGSKWGETKSED